MTCLMRMMRMIFVIRYAIFSIILRIILDTIIILAAFCTPYCV